VIDPALVEWLFSSTRQRKREGRVSWDVDGVCRWSFFFVDEDPERLIRAGEALARAGYEFVGLLRRDVANDDRDLIFLRVDRIERHTVESLVARNAELDEFADAHDLSYYDGMDVGHVDGP
jgi:hypothetical protein